MVRSACQIKLDQTERNSEVLNLWSLNLWNLSYDVKSISHASRSLYASESDVLFQAVNMHLCILIPSQSDGDQINWRRPQMF